MNTNKITVVLGVIIVLIIAGGYLFNQFNTKPEISQSLNAPVNLPQVTKPSINQISYNCESGKTAFEELQDTAEDLKFEGSAMGRFITAINGKSQGNGKYWLYSIDGKDATVSADSYLCSGNEEIKWELR